MKEVGARARMRCKPSVPLVLVLALRRLHRALAPRQLTVCRLQMGSPPLRCDGLLCWVLRLFCEVKFT